MALAAQRTGPVYVGLQEPRPEGSRERLEAARARRGFLRWLGTLTIACFCLTATTAITVATMQAGYKLDAINRQLAAARVQEQRDALRLQQAESLSQVAASAARLGMHTAPDYQTLPVVMVHSAPRLRSRSVVVDLPSPPSRQLTPAAIWNHVRRLLGLPAAQPSG